MTLTRSLFLTVACALPLSVAACGGSDDKPSPDAAVVVPNDAKHYGYVVSEATLSSTATLDFGSDKSNKPDGTPENLLGGTLSTLVGFGFPIQATITEAVDTGAILMLADLQTTDFTNAAAAGLSLKIGTNPQPPACNGDTDSVCRHHLDGTAMFGLDSTAPTNPPVTGPIVNGTFNAGAGPLALQIALGSTEPVTLNLVNARVKATAISSTNMTAIIGGQLLAQDLNDNILPAIHAQITPIIVRDCQGTQTPPGCGCTGTGLSLITVFDGKGGSPADCAISLDEVKNNSTLKALLKPDVCSSTSCTAADALSLSVNVTAVKATFPGLE